MQEASWLVRPWHGRRRPRPHSTKAQFQNHCVRSSGRRLRCWRFAFRVSLCDLLVMNLMRSTAADISAERILCASSCSLYILGLSRSPICIESYDDDLQTMREYCSLCSEETCMIVIHSMQLFVPLRIRLVEMSGELSMAVRLPDGRSGRIPYGGDRAVLIREPGSYGRRLRPEAGSPGHSAKLSNCNPQWMPSS